MSVQANMERFADSICRAGVSKQGSCQHHHGSEFDGIDIEGFGNAGAPVDDRREVA